MTASQVPPGDTATTIAARALRDADGVDGDPWHDEAAQAVVDALAAAGFGDLSGLLTDLRALADRSEAGFRGITFDGTPFPASVATDDLRTLLARYTPDDPQEAP